MPNCIQLTRKSAPEAGPVEFNLIDEEICAFLDIPVDDTNYVYDWYDTICMRLAMGMSFAQIVASCHETGDKYPEYKTFYAVIIKICGFLDEHFTTDAWAMRGSPR